MSLAVSTVDEYRQDPKFMQELEMRTREDLVGMQLFNAKFFPELKRGRVINVDREFNIDVSSTDGYEVFAYQTLNTNGRQTFTVDDGAREAIQIFDTDEIQTVFDLHSRVMETGGFAMNQYMDKKAFSKLYSNGAIELDTVDISGTESAASKGNALYDALMEANESFDAIGLKDIDRKFVMFPTFFRYLKSADKLTAEVEKAYTRTTNGQVPMSIDGILHIAKSINLHKATSTYTLTAKGDIEVGKMYYSDVVVDDGAGSALTKPMIGDYFTNNSKIVIIQAVKKISDTEYQLLLNRPIETQIDDDAEITVTGGYKAYVPVCQGVVGTSAIQKAPTFEALRDKDYPATYVRSQTVFDFFVTAESTRKLVHIPVKYRSISGGTWN